MARVSLLTQYQALKAAALDLRLSGGDKACHAVGVDRYMQKHGNSRVSITYMMAATGLGRDAVVNSRRRLVDYGYLRVARVGVGTRPTEYEPIWRGGGSSTPEHTAAEENSSGTVEQTTSSSVEQTASASSGTLEQTESYLRIPADKPAIRVGRYMSDGVGGGASHPPGGAAPIGAPPAGKPPRSSENSDDPFNQLWRAYGVRKDRAKAREAFGKLNLDAETLADMIAAAERWRASYEENDTPQRWHVRLHTWLTKEKWEEDPPPPYEQREPKTKRRSSTSTERDSDEPDTSPLPSYRTARIDSSDVDANGRLTVSMTDVATGEALTWNMPIESANPHLRKMGRSDLASLCRAVGVESIDDTDALHGATVCLLRHGRGDTFVSAAVGNR